MAAYYFLFFSFFFVGWIFCLLLLGASKLSSLYLSLSIASGESISASKIIYLWARFKGKGSTFALGISDLNYENSGLSLAQSTNC